MRCFISPLMCASKSGPSVQVLQVTKKPRVPSTSFVAEMQPVIKGQANSVSHQRPPRHTATTVLIIHHAPAVVVSSAGPYLLIIYIYIYIKTPLNPTRQWWRKWDSTSLLPSHRLAYSSGCQQRAKTLFSFYSSLILATALTFSDGNWWWKRKLPIYISCRRRRRFLGAHHSRRPSL